MHQHRRALFRSMILLLLRLYRLLKQRQQRQLEYFSSDFGSCSNDELVALLLYTTRNSKYFDKIVVIPRYPKTCFYPTLIITLLAS
jgi:hypothetical protein